MKLLARHRRLVGEERDEARAELARRYAQGATLRELAVAVGWSYGGVRRLLLESHVPLRRRGGNMRRQRVVSLPQSLSGDRHAHG
ncbi:hypothetical protein FHR81_003207 [Actinoalloteichus hoggarensis]|nr:helix-turn-helix domain-containing protein [Actinoalloteichus hoggarensis]MBB5922155.1 hypothetical protein [Actinoalloteichus hoggarensis]